MVKCNAQSTYVLLNPTCIKESTSQFAVTFAVLVMVLLVTRFELRSFHNVLITVLCQPFLFTQRGTGNSYAL